MKDKARVIKRQRIVSYPLGWLVLHLTDAPRIYEAVAVTNTLVTPGLTLANFMINDKASGHAAGVAGPPGLWEH